MADRCLAIYVSSPNDVLDERSAVLQVIDRLQYDPFLNGAAQLRVVSWDNPAAPLPLPASEPPQAAINDMQARPAECDVFVGVFWSRLGTPLQAVAGTGEVPPLTGTAWEIEDALNGGPGRPDVLIYRKTAPALVRLDADWKERGEQYDALQSYVAALQTRLGRQGHGRLHDYETLDQFRTAVDAHLRHTLARRLGLSARHRDPDASWRTSRSPYPGLVAFTSADAAVFFG